MEEEWRGRYRKGTEGVIWKRNGDIEEARRG